MMNWTGLHAPDMIASLFKQFDPSCHASFVTSPTKSSLQTRSKLTPAASDIVSEAKEFRTRHGVPFWDTVMLLSQERPVPADLLRQALFHNKKTGTPIRVPAASLDGRAIRLLAEERRAEGVLGLLSTVEVQDGSPRHIPMLDFRWAPTPENKTAVSALLPDLGCDGLLLDSGNSFHFYGIDLMTQEELTRFLGQALLLGPIVDRRWVAHQLMEGCCVLRVSEGLGGSPSEPVVVAVVAGREIDR